MKVSNETETPEPDKFTFVLYIDLIPDDAEPSEAASEAKQ